MRGGAGAVRCRCRRVSERTRRSCAGMLSNELNMREAAAEFRGRAGRCRVWGARSQVVSSWEDYEETLVCSLGVVCQRERFRRVQAIQECPGDREGARSLGKRCELSAGGNGGLWGAAGHRETRVSGLVLDTVVPLLDHAKTLADQAKAQGKKLETRGAIDPSVGRRECIVLRNAMRAKGLGEC